MGVAFLMVCTGFLVYMLPRESSGECGSFIVIVSGGKLQTEAISRNGKRRKVDPRVEGK